MFEDELNCEGMRRAIAEDSMRDFSAAQEEHFASCDDCADLLLTRMLNRRPEVAIPADFAANVGSRLQESAARTKAVRSVPAYGFTTAIAVLMVLALAWGVWNYFDPRWWALNGTLSLVLESFVTLEIGAIALWLGIRRSVM